jgi:two-component system response regulator
MLGVSMIASGPAPVLLVEDNPDDESLAVQAFAAHGVPNPLVVVRDGAEAIDWLLCRGRHAGRAPQAPALVLLDLNLPRVSGLRVLEQIRADARTRLLPTVILTSSDEERDLVASYERGANSFVVKPFDFEQFLQLVGTLSSYWLTVNRAPP